MRAIYSKDEVFLVTFFAGTKKVTRVLISEKCERENEDVGNARKKQPVLFSFSVLLSLYKITIFVKLILSELFICNNFYWIAFVIEQDKPVFTVIRNANFFSMVTIWYFVFQTMNFGKNTVYIYIMTWQYKTGMRFVCFFINVSVAMRGKFLKR